MKIHPWTSGIVMTACVLAFGCQSDSSAPSDPAAELSTAALSPADQALANQINADIKCTFNGGQENAMLKRFGNAVKKKDRNQINPLQAMISEQITDVFAKWEEGTHIQNCGEPEAEVVARLIVNLAAFGGFEELDPDLVEETLANGGSVKIFRLEDGGGDVLEDGCVGYFIPPQTSNTGWITVLFNEPATDPGFGAFPNTDTAPFWLQIDASFSGPFAPKIQTGWFVIEQVGQFPPNPGAQPPPIGADLRSCTIRDGGEGPDVLLCGEEEDLETTSGELDQGAIACQSDTAMNLEGWRGMAWNVFQPAARLIDPNPLYAFPGNTGLRSSFASPFGITFEDLIATTTDLSPTSSFLSDLQTQTFTATVDPAPDNDNEPVVRFYIDKGTGNEQTFEDDLDDGEGLLEVQCRPFGGPPDEGIDLAVGAGSHTVDATFLGDATHATSDSNTATLDCSTYGPS